MVKGNFLRRRAATWIAAMMVWMCAAPVAQAGTVHEKVLDNGLKVLVMPDRRAPVVTSQLWFRAGSMDEPAGATGIAHMFEHMMFKGTETMAPGEFSERVARLGGRDNAFTSRDFTAYYQTVAADHLSDVMAWEADRLMNLALDEQEFLRERDVVKEEWRTRFRDNPDSRLYAMLQATAFVSSGYHHPVIGWEGDIDNYTLEDLKKWRAAHYAPNNAILVVVGDVDPEATFRLAEEHYGPVPARELPAAKPRQEITQQGTRSVDLKLPARLPRLMMGYKVPSLASVDAQEAWVPDALAVLAGVLSGGDSARFAEDLVRPGRLAAASASYDPTARAQTLLTISAVPNDGQSLEEVEQLLRAQLARLGEEPVTAEELERIKTQVIASDVYGRDSMFYQGMRLGIYETAGIGHEEAADYVERIEAVTAEQLQTVARRYFNDQGLTIARLHPQTEDMPKGGSDA
ncbi:MAG: M16 family metallopeptidase [Halothiobacillaceae bacterium]